MNAKQLLLCLLVGCSLASGGCRGNGAFVVGNFTSMAIVLVMLWSTVNLNRD